MVKVFAPNISKNFQEPSCEESITDKEKSGPIGKKVRHMSRVAEDK